MREPNRRQNYCLLTPLFIVSRCTRVQSNEGTEVRQNRDTKDGSEHAIVYKGGKDQKPGNNE